MPPRVLMYHGFGRRRPEEDPHSLFVAPEDFGRQLRLIQRYLRPVALSDYLEGLRTSRWPRRSVLVTMDDAYVSALEVAAPMLAERGIPAVLFACPGRLDGTSAWMEEMPDERLLGADGLRALARFGIEVGVHGMDHRGLPGLSRRELRTQVAGAREALADVTGHLPRAFAYPEGLFDVASVRAVWEAGYEVAFSVEDGGGRFAVRRLPVTSRDSLLTFAGKLLPGYARLERRSVGRPGLRRAAARLLGQRRRGAR